MLHTHSKVWLHAIWAVKSKESPLKAGYKRRVAVMVDTRLKPGARLMANSWRAE